MSGALWFDMQIIQVLLFEMDDENVPLIKTHFSKVKLVKYVDMSSI